MSSQELSAYSIRLDPGGNDTRSVDFTTPQAGLWRLVVELRRASDAQAYRTVDLWIRAS